MSGGVASPGHNPLKHFRVLSTAEHSSVERKIKEGVSFEEAITQVCKRAPSVNDIESFALVASTRRSLMSVEEELRQQARISQNPPFHPTTIKRAIQAMLQKGWKPSSMLTRVRYMEMLSTRVGAWHSPQQWFEDLKKGIGRLAALDHVKQAVPLSFTQLQTLLTSLRKKGKRELEAFFALTWLLAGRLGEIRHIPTCHLRHNQVPVTVKFSIMKGVFGPQEKALAAGPLCDIVTKWAAHLQTHHPTRKKLFKLNHREIMKALKTLDSRLSGHSFRRGALQHANNSGMSGEDMRVLSGHKTTFILQRYLGMASPERKSAMLRVTRTLQ